MNDVINLISSIKMRVLLSCTLLILLPVNVIFATTDDIQLDLSKEQPVKLRWFNVEGGNNWVSGNQPVKFNNRYSVTLKKDEVVSFIIPAGAQLRLISSDDKSLANFVNIEQSTDGYLYLKKELQWYKNNNSLLLDTASNETSLIRLTGLSIESTNFEIYYSVRSKKNTLSHYRELVELDSKKHVISSYPDLGRQTYHKLTSGEVAETEIVGPANLKIQLRRSYRQLASVQGDAIIDVMLDDELQRKNYFEFNDDKKRVVQVHGTNESVSAASSQFLYVPTGRHKLSLRSYNNVYIRVLKQEDENYYSYDLNKPSWFDSEKHDLNNNTIDKCEISDVETTNYSFSKDYVSIQKLARNNALFNSGLAAMHQLENIAVKNPDQKGLTQLIKRNKSRHGHYADLLPESDGSGVPHRVYRYTKKKLRHESDDNESLPEENLIAYYLKTIPEATFHQQSESSPLKFKLQNNNSSGDIRLLVIPDKRNNTKLNVLFNNGLKFQIKLNDSHLERKHTERTIVEKIMKSKCCDELVNYFSNSKINKVSVIRIPFDNSATSFSIVSDNDKPVWVAAQLYASDQYRLDEEQYLSELDHHKLHSIKFHQLISSLLTNNYESNDGDIISSLNMLDNFWLPEAKRYASVYRHFIKNIDYDNVFIKSTEIYTALQLSSLTKDALEAEQENQWLLAIERWNEISQHSKGDKQREAVFKLVNNMQNNGYLVLAEKLLRALSLQSDDVTSQEKAVNTLLNHYKRYYKTAESAKSLSLYVSLFVRHGHQKWLPDLIASLVKNGQWLSALQLTHMLPAKLRPHEFVLLAAGKTGWWNTYKQSRSFLSKDLSLVWKGHEYFFRGEYDKAIPHYKDAGVSAKNWLAYTKQLHDIKNKVSSLKALLNAEIINQWNTLLFKKAFPKMWEKSNWLIQKHGGGLSILNSSQQRRYNGYLSDGNADIEMEVLGPARLKLVVNPLHKTADYVTPEDVWYKVHINGQAINFPIIGSTPSETLQIENSSDRPGKSVSTEIELSAGVHNITISSDQRLIVAPYLIKPVIPVPAFSSFSIDEMKRIVIKASKKDDLSFRVIESSVWRKMVDYLEQSKELGSKIKLSLAKAEELYSNNKHDPTLRRLLSRIGHSARWQSVGNITQSAGIRQIEQINSNWQPETPAWRFYSSLFNESEPANKIISINERIGISVFNTAKVKMNLNVSVLTPWYIDKHPVSVYYQIDNGKKYKERINKSGIVSITVPAGKHYINLEMQEAEPNHFLKFVFTEQAGRSVIDRKRLRYHIATHDEPLEFIVNGPAWIRIDKLYSDTTKSNYQFVEDQVHKISLLPDSDQNEVLIRAFRRVPGYVEKKSDLPWHDKQQPLMYSQTIDKLKSNVPEQFFDNIALGGQEDGTLSYQAVWVDRQSLEDEELTGADNFIEIGASYRYYNSYDDIWFKSQAVIRLRGQSDDSIGLRSRIRGHINWLPLDWDFKAGLFSQSLSSGTAVSTKFDFTLSQLRKIGQKIYHIPKLNTFLRTQKGNFNQTEFIDADVYSDYKRDHLSGLIISDSVFYKPYLDMEFYAGIKITSNEDILDIDNHKLTTGWRQLFGPYRLNTALNKTSYYQDNDRQADYQQTKLSINLGWEYWRINRNRIEIQLEYEHDFYNDDNNIKIKLKYHTSSGRDYRDFSKDEILFRGLRITRQPAETNNELY